MTDHDIIAEAFQKTGVTFEECDERALKTAHPIPNATRYISVDVAHFHFDAKGSLLGVECNGDGKFIPRLNT